jgi:serine/threonine protein kinase
MSSLTTTQFALEPHVTKDQEAAAILPAGVAFGRYRLVEPLGRGGMAQVFRAVINGPKGFARTLAIKRILPHFSRHAHFVDMLAREAKLCGLLRHPNIVQVHEFGVVAGEHYLAMELVDGHDLQAVTRALASAECRMPVSVACRIVSELAGALGYAHAVRDAAGRGLGLVHRDVSPSNVMIGSLGTVKLVDFGIAKAAAQLREITTATGALKGKLGYMSPEQVEGLPLDGRSDLFALGVLFWELLTQRRLFAADSGFGEMRLVCAAKVPPPSQLVDGLDPVIDAVVLKLLARRREDRFQTAEAVVAMLQPMSSHSEALRQTMADLAPFFGPRCAPLGGAEPERYSSATLTVVDAVPPMPATQTAVRAPRNPATLTALLAQLRPVSELSFSYDPGQSATRRWALTGAVVLGLVLLLLGGWAVGARREARSSIEPAPVATSPTNPFAPAAASPSSPPVKVSPHGDGPGHAKVKPVRPRREAGYDDRVIYDPFTGAVEKGIVMAPIRAPARTGSGRVTARRPAQ